MATANQLQKIYKSLMSYRKRYLKKKFAELDESATRLMVNNLFTEVLGYIELEDIKTEYRIKGEYADYVIQLNRKKRMIVEVKAIQLDLNEKHLRQSINYAANEGIEWIMLTNGKSIQIYRVIFGKPLKSKLLADIDLSDIKQIKSNLELLFMLCKKSMQKDEIEVFWKRFQALDPKQLTKVLYTEEIVKVIRRVVKKEVGFNFDDDDILDALEKLIKSNLDCPRPKNPSKRK